MKLVYTGTALILVGLGLGLLAYYTHFITPKIFYAVAGVGALLLLWGLSQSESTKKERVVRSPKKPGASISNSNLAGVADKKAGGAAPKPKPKPAAVADKKTGGAAPKPSPAAVADKKAAGAAPTPPPAADTDKKAS